MRKVILGMNITLDGFVAGPNGELDWMFPHFDSEFLASTMETLSTIDTFVMGRVNYEQMAAHWPTAQDPIAPIMNAARKLVFSKTLRQLEWANAKLADGPPADVIHELKRGPGNNIGVTGGARFARSVIEAGLVDEFHLSMHPVSLGAGLAIFPGRFDLQPLSSKLFPKGVIITNYQTTQRSV
jgi:dihydrofolate reductase